MTTGRWDALRLELSQRRARPAGVDAGAGAGSPLWAAGSTSPGARL